MTAASYDSAITAFPSPPLQQVTLESGHATYEQLKEPTLPVWKSIYFFNLTNPEEFHDGAAPVVVQVGPYSYRWVWLVHSSACYSP